MSKKRLLSDLSSDLHSTGIPALWCLDDIAAYLKCTNPTAATKLPGFPNALQIPGVRGPRWHAPSVDEYFRSAAEAMAADGAGQRTVPPIERPTARELLGGN